MIIINALINDYPYFLSTALMVIGIWGMLAKHNLFKKLLGMNIFQTAIIMFFICGAYKSGATVPIIDSGSTLEAFRYVNPLPHVLMLTAIVVMVATSGVSLALLILIYRRYKTLDEREILKEMKK